MRSRVTPGRFSVMESLRPMTLLKNVLLPTFGLPTMAMRCCINTSCQGVFECGSKLCRKLRRDVGDVLAVRLDKADDDALLAAGGNVLPDAVRTEGKLSVPTVNEAEETDALRPAERRERRKRCPHRSSRIKNVVAEDDPLALDVEIDLAPL